jgi:hypothetical protein
MIANVNSLLIKNDAVSFQHVSIAKFYVIYYLIIMIKLAHFYFLSFILVFIYMVILNTLKDAGSQRGGPASRPGRACGICGGQSGIGAGFLRVLRFPLPTIIPRISPSLQ